MPFSSLFHIPLQACCRSIRWRRVQRIGHDWKPCQTSKQCLLKLPALQGTGRGGSRQTLRLPDSGEAWPLGPPSRQGAHEAHEARSPVASLVQQQLWRSWMVVAGFCNWQPAQRPSLSSGACNANSKCHVQDQRNEWFSLFAPFSQAAVLHLSCRLPRSCRLSRSQL